MGIDFGGTKIAMATASASGSILRRVRLETRAPDGAKEVVRRALAAARDLVAETPGQLAAAGVSTFGVVRDGRVRLAPNVPGWEDLPLPDLLADGLGVHVHIDNDVNAATAAEIRWGSLTGVDTGLYVNLGTGIGAGLVVGGHVVPGAHGAAGEIGYFLRTAGEPGFTAGHAPLEEYASGSGLAGRGAALLTKDEASAADLFARRSDPRVAVLLTDAAEALGLTVANLATFLDPEIVVIGGGMTTAFLTELRAAVTAATPFAPPVRPARFVDDAALVGAIALAISPPRPHQR